MSDTWGKGSVNNNIGWGQAAGSATNNWGKSQKESWAGQTDIVGVASVSITYSSSAFCSDANDPTPTISNNAGAGTFSSTAGLIFISTTTGEVDLDASTAGATYVITYTDTDAATATFSLTINDLDNAAFAYSASSYEPTNADPTPTITGLTGGTFSGTTGLVINSTTGEIDLSASTIASHTITYDTTSSGSSVCPNTSTQTVEIAVAAISNNFSMRLDGASSERINISSVISSISSSSTGSISFWVKPESSSIGDWHEVISFASNTADRSYLIFYKSNTEKGYLQFRIGQSQIFQLQTNSAVFSANTWAHVVITQNGIEPEIYINGSKPAQTFLSSVNKTYWWPNLSSFNTANINAMIWISSGTQIESFGVGVINVDEVGIWNTDLSSTQVSEIYNATSAGLTKDLSTIEPSNLKYFNRMGD